MQEVEAVCDRVIIINNGLLIADSPTAELQKLWQGKEMITVQFKEEVDPKALQQLEGVEEVETISSSSFKIRAGSDNSIRETIYEFSKTQQLTLMEMHSDEIKLEDIFQKLTQK
jgi:ABC-2 type transport system ATP-binding protein